MKKYNRVLLKLSGESLAGDKGMGIDFEKVLEICAEIKEVVEKTNVEVAIVVGGGNFWRGRSNQHMDRCTSDHIGMLGTTMNALAINDAFKQLGFESRVQTGIEMRQIAEFYIKNRAERHLQKGRVVIFGCGTGSPFFSTDTAAALRSHGFVHPASAFPLYPHPARNQTVKKQPALCTVPARYESEPKSS